MRFSSTSIGMQYAHLGSRILRQFNSKKILEHAQQASPTPNYEKNLSVNRLLRVLSVCSRNYTGFCLMKYIWVAVTPLKTASCNLKPAASWNLDHRVPNLLFGLWEAGVRECCLTSICVGFEELPQPISPVIAFYFSVETVPRWVRENVLLIRGCEWQNHNFYGWIFFAWCTFSFSGGFIFSR